MWCSAVQCSALQCSVVRCSALQCSAVRYSKIKISKPTQIRAVDLFLFSVCIFYGPNTKNFKRNIFCLVPAWVQTSVQRATAVTKDRSAFNSAQTSWFLVLTEKSPPLATRLLREKGGLTLWWEREYVVNFYHLKDQMERWFEDDPFTIIQQSTKINLLWHNSLIKWEKWYSKGVQNVAHLMKNPNNARTLRYQGKFSYISRPYIYIKIYNWNQQRLVCLSNNSLPEFKKNGLMTVSLKAKPVYRLPFNCT